MSDILVFIITEWFTLMVDDEGLENAKAYLIGSPGTNGLMSPPKSTKVTLISSSWGKAECILKGENLCCIVELGPRSST